MSLFVGDMARLNSLKFGSWTRGGCLSNFGRGPDWSDQERPQNWFPGGMKGSTSLTEAEVLGSPMEGMCEGLPVSNMQSQWSRRCN